MSIVCAYTDGTTTWVGSDTRSVGADHMPLDSGPKWYFSRNEYGWGFGHIGDARASDLIARGCDYLFKDLCDADEFPDRLVQVYTAGGMKPIFKDGETVGNWNNAGLLVRPGEIYDVDGQLSILKLPTYELHARGCAGPEGRGAAYGYKRAKPEAMPAEIICVALDAAARFDVYIGASWQTKLRPGGYGAEDTPQRSAPSDGMKQRRVPRPFPLFPTRFVPGSKRNENDAAADFQNRMARPRNEDDAARNR